MEQATQSAIILTGGKQYRVKPGMALKIEKLAHNVGDEVTFADEALLMIGGETPVVGADLKGRQVTAKVVRHGRHDKIRIIKMRRRKTYRLRQGHRQHFTEIEILNIA